MTGAGASSGITRHGLPGAGVKRIVGPGESCAGFITLWGLFASSFGVQYSCLFILLMAVEGLWVDYPALLAPVARIISPAIRRGLTIYGLGKSTNRYS